MTIMKNLIAGGLTLILGTGMAFGDTPNHGNNHSNSGNHGSIGNSHGKSGSVNQQGTSGNLVTGQMVACTTYTPAQIKQIKTFLHDSKITLAQAIELGQNGLQNGQFIECELVTTGNGPAFDYEAFVNNTFTCATICGTEGKVASTATPTPNSKQQTYLTSWKAANQNAKINASEALVTVTKQFNNALPFNICLTQNNNTPVWKIECFRSDSVWTTWVDAVDGKVITPTGTGSGSH